MQPKKPFLTNEKKKLIHEKLKEMKITCPAETVRQMINCASRNLQWKLEVKWGFWNKVWVE
jgi:hypothetical protein